MMKVRELLETLKEVNWDSEIYITSDDEMPIRKIVSIEWEEKKGCYSEVYLNTKEVK